MLEDLTKIYYYKKQLKTTKGILNIIRVEFNENSDPQMLLLLLYYCFPSLTNPQQQLIAQDSHFLLQILEYKVEHINRTSSSECCFKGSTPFTRPLNSNFIVNVQQFLRIWF